MFNYAHIVLRKIRQITINQDLIKALQKNSYYGSTIWNNLKKQI